MRVHELSKELGVPSKDIISKLKDAGFEVKSHMSAIPDDGLELFMESDSAEAAPAAAAEEPAVEPPVAEEAPAKTEEDAPANEPEPAEAEEAPASGRTVLHFVGPIIVKDLARELGVKPNIIIAELMKMNVLASINERVELTYARKIAEQHGFDLEYEKKQADHQAPVKEAFTEEALVEDKDEDLELRPPVVTFLGHVDHGKTSLLDYIRNAKVASGEHGGITQHIGAYRVNTDAGTISFLDTPGHAAFTAMRARGANLTDIAVIVIAADDGIMPQTREAIQHAQAAEVTLMVAINKVDLPSANPDRILQELQQMNMTPEEWGGDLICCRVSAETGEGIDQLLEMILLQSEVLELRANRGRMANGTVIEAQLEAGRGPTAHVLVTGGTLKIGDTILCGNHYGRVKAMINERGEKIKKASPSTPCKILGLSGVPEAGAPFQVYKNEKSARVIAEKRAREEKEAELKTTGITSLDDFFAQVEREDQVELTLIIKADTQGSIEAIQHVLGEIKSDNVTLKFVLAAIGNITVNDVLLAKASSAIIMGFHVGKENGVGSAQKRESVDIRLHHIIYELVDEVRAAMLGLVEPTYQETIVAHAEIKQVFPISKIGKVAGCLVTDGTVKKESRARILREGDVVYEGSISTLKRFQDDAKQVLEGQECGIALNKFTKIAVGDIIEVYEVAEIAATL